MEKTMIMLLLLLGSWMTMCAQEVKVYDMATLQPLSDVAVISAGRQVAAVTNHRGRVVLPVMEPGDSITFSHVSYLSRTLSYSELQRMEYRVMLTEMPHASSEVIISASRFEEESRDVAQQVQVIRQSDIRFFNQSTSADLMAQSGNIQVQKSQLGGGSPIIRGFETNKVLIVVDGVRMNNAIYRGGHLQNIITLDNMAMDKVEILFGPGSVVYGSDALGGVMHFHTRNPILSDSDELAVTGGAFLRYGSAANEQSGHVSFSIAGKKFGSFTSLTHSDFGDLRQGAVRNPFYGDWGKRPWYVDRINGRDSIVVNENENVQVGSAYRQIDLLQKFLFRQNDKVSHILNFQYSTSSDVPRYDRLTLLSGSNPRFAEWYYGPQERIFASYSVQFRDGGRFYDEGRITLGYQAISETRHDRRFNQDVRNNRYEDVTVLTLNADFARHIGEHEIRYGMDAWINDVTSTARTLNIVTGDEGPLSTRYPDGGSTMRSAAWYVTHAWEISDKLILNDGIRINQVDLNASFRDKQFFPFPFDEITQSNINLNGNIGLVYLPAKKWRISMMAATGFRAPNVDDLSKVFESVPGRVIVPNPDLKPETTYNLDLGVQREGNGIAVGFNAFYTWYRDAITVRPGLFEGQDSIDFDGQLSQVTTTVNDNRAYLYGISAFFRAEFNDHVSFHTTYNYTFGRFQTDTTDYPLDHIAPAFGRSSLMARTRKFRGEFFVMYSAAKRSEDYNLIGEDNASYSADPVNGFMPAWLTLNVRGAYQFNRFLQVQLALENILDHNYRVFSSNISGPGRNFTVTLRSSF